jgi:hypothetical protein
MGYFFILVCTAILFYTTIIRNVYLYFKGEYNPYPFREGKREFPYIIRLGINLIIYFSITFALNYIKFSSISVIFLCYSICFLLCLNILNYLSYVKMKEKQIIIQTVILNSMIIIFGIWFYKYFF